MAYDLRPCAGEPELSDARYTGEFAREMATLASQPHIPPWCGYFLWDGDTPLAFGGFKGPPDEDGAVEIGYLTFPQAVGRGLATEVAQRLTAIAAGEGSTAVLAHTLPEPNASVRVLEKAGFTRDGWGEDDDVGRVWRWRYNV